jgi:hypothetical protein
MMKRHLAGLIVAATVIGSGAVAAAAPGDRPRPPKEQVAACREAHKAGQAPSEECKQLRERAQERRKPRPRPGQVALAHAIHGDLLVKTKDGKFETVTLDKGVVESKGDNSLTLKRDDGKTVTLRVNDDTTYKGVDSFAAVVVGKPAIVISKDGTARHVGQRAPGRNNPNGGNVGGSEEQVPAT